MSNFLRRALLLFLLPGILVSLGQDVSRYKNALTWREIAPKTENLAVGDVFQITFEVTIAKGFHLYSAKQPSDAVLPAIFELDKTSKGVALVGGLQEKGDRHVYHDDIFEADIAQYEGKVIFIQQIKITGPEVNVEGGLSYQVCDDAMCIPGTQEVRRTFKAKPKTDAIAPATDTVQPVADTAKATTPPAAPAQTPGKITSQVAADDCGGNLWLLFLQTLGLGLIAVLTPCVFPMIPLTVSIFTKRKAKTRAEGIRNALTYAGSIVFIFTFLGLLLALIFGPNVLTDMANNAWFNVFFFALLVLFGLSFLGWFELTLPSSWSTTLTVEGNKRGGFLGIFMLAGALTVVSFACTGPMVSTALLGATEHACFSSPIVAMLGFSLGLAFPFGFFAFAPSALSSLPSSGGWLNTVKVIMGIGEIALAMTYLSGADLVMHWGLLDREIFLSIWMVLFTILGLNILGKLPLEKDDPVTNISTPRLILGGLSLVFVLYMLPGLFGARLPMINGFLPPMNKDMVVIGAGGTGGSSAVANPNEICGYPNKVLAEYEEHTPPGFCTFYDLDQAKEYAKKVGKPLFVDFTGFNCKNCRYVEGESWPKVQQTLTSDYVMVSLYNDDGTKLPEPIVLPDGSKLRTLGDKIRQYQIENFQNNGAPYYVLMTADGKVLDQMGYDGSGSAYTEKLASFLRKGLGK